MAAAIAAMHRQGAPSGRTKNVDEDIDEKSERIFKITSALPDEHQRHTTLELGMLMMDGYCCK